MKMLEGNGWTVSTKGTENSPMVLMVQDLCEAYPQFSEMSNKERIGFLKEHKDLSIGELIQRIAEIPLRGNGWAARFDEERLIIQHNTTYDRMTYILPEELRQEAMRILKKEKSRRYKACCQILLDLCNSADNASQTI